MILFVVRALACWRAPPYVMHEATARWTLSWTTRAGSWPMPRFGQEVSLGVKALLAGVSRAIFFNVGVDQT